MNDENRNSTIYLYLPTIFLVILTQIIIKLFPSPKAWLTGLIATILIRLTLCYLYWRSLSTLNLPNSVFSTLLLKIKSLFMLGTLSQLDYE